MSVIVKNLTKSFNGKKVIDNISFEVSEGEFCILLGPSGCGKTTILRLIAGLERQDSGEIFIDGKEVSNLSPGERDIAMVFQSYALYPHMNVYENMAFPLRVRKLSEQEIDKKVRETARLLNIEELLKRKPKELSGGQRQRVAIGRAIIRNPKLFLFDEPLSNLDAKLRILMRVEIARLHQKLRTTTIYVTHDQVEAMTLGQKIILLNEGVIQQIGTPEEVYNEPANLFVASFIGTPPINLLEGIIEADTGGIYFKSGDIVINLESLESLREYAGKEVTAGIRPESLVPGQGPFSGIIEHIEYIGAEKILYIIPAGKSPSNRVDILGPKITIRTTSTFQGGRGESICFSVDTSRIHFFYKGLRII